MCGFSEKKVLVTCVPNNKLVVWFFYCQLMIHEDDKMSETTGTTEKPEIITYDLDVDIVDHMKEEYSVGRMTRRWPMR